MHPVNVSTFSIIDFKNCFEGWLRGFIADYGVPLMVLAWTAVSYIPANDVPKGIPRRLVSPNPWSPHAYSNWTVIKVLSCSILYISRTVSAYSQSVSYSTLF